MAIQPFFVFWKDSAGVTTEITSDVLTIPQFSDTGSGEVNTCVLLITANRGKYITDSHPIQDFDKIRLKSFDSTGVNFYEQVYEVKRRIPTTSKNGGAKLELHLLGLEWHAQSSNFSDSVNSFVSDAFSMSKRIQGSYNENAGLLDPSMTGLDSSIANKLPNWTANNYEFGNNEESAYNRLMEIIDKMAAPKNAGGVFDFFETKANGNIDSNSFDMFVFSSGITDLGVVITNTRSVNVGPTEGGLDAIKGTVVNGWGDSQAGSLPPGFSKFQGGQLLYPLFPQWKNDANYPKDALVQYAGLLWQSTIDNNLNNVPSISDWTPITQADYYGNVYRYSEWTCEQAIKWRASGVNLNIDGDPTTPPFAFGIFDGNLVVNDPSSKYFRTWVDVVAADSVNIPSDWKYSHVAGVKPYYEGFRVLVNGTGLNEFAGNDVNGIPFTNSIVEWSGDDLGWLVKYQPQDDMVCAVLLTGSMYRFTSGSWASFIADNAWDCFHYPITFPDNDDIQSIDPTFIMNNKSAVHVIYQFNPVTDIVDTPPFNPQKINYFNYGAWLSVRFPLPTNIFYEPLGFVGELYGTNAIIKGPAFIDAGNMTYTHDGLVGYSQGTSSEDLGPLNSLAFLIKIKATLKDPGGDFTLLASEANFKIRVTMYDRNDNVAIQDFNVPFNDNAFPALLPLNGFSIYQARRPINSLLNLIVPPVAVSPVNVFEWRHIKQISIATAESYDGEGRYAIPPTTRYGKPLWTTVNPADTPFDQTRQLEMWVDAFRFVKPLLVNSETEGDRNIETEFIQRPEVIIYQQLKGLVQEEYLRAKFPHNEYDVVTTLRHDIAFGDSFYLYDPLIVGNPPQEDGSDHGDLVYPNAGMPAGATTKTVDSITYYDFTVKLVAKRIEYSYTKPLAGSGGAIRRLIGVRRFGRSG